MGLREIVTKIAVPRLIVKIADLTAIAIALFAFDSKLWIALAIQMYPYRLSIFNRSVYVRRPEFR